MQTAYFYSQTEPAIPRAANVLKPTWVSVISTGYRIPAEQVFWSIPSRMQPSAAVSLPWPHSLLVGNGPSYRTGIGGDRRGWQPATGVIA
jgi:hypothetical protein